MATTTLVGSKEFTLGGLLTVNGEVFGLTVAHPFGQPPLHLYNTL